MRQQEYKDKKIAVIGIGGVGGYTAAMLAAEYPNVTAAARGRRGEAIRRAGIRVHSDHHGELSVMPHEVVSSADQMEPQDYIFICVKNYSLEEVCHQIRGIVEKDTVIIPVMNGADVGERVRKYLKKGIVIDTVIYIVAFANPDHSITQQGNFASLRIGTRIEEEAYAVEQVSEILRNAEITYKISKDIEQDIWKKYILNCAYNVSTACYNNTIGELRRNPDKAKEYEQLIYEAYEVAAARGVNIQKEDAEKMIKRFYEELSEDATSSLQRDVWGGKETELETFSGYMVREATRLGVKVPVTVRMYKRLSNTITDCTKIKTCQTAVLPLK